MEPNVTISDLAKVIDEIKVHQLEGWSTSTVVTVLSIVVAIILLVGFILVKFRDKVRDNTKGIGDNTNGIIELKIDIKEIREDIKEIQDNISKLTGNFEFIKRFITLFVKDSGGIELTETNSPITLNEKGLSIAEKIGSREIVNRHFKQLEKKCVPLPMLMLMIYNKIVLNYQD